MLDTKLEQSERGDCAANLYEQDFYAWTQDQAELLRLGKWQALDIENLAEEIESLGKQQKQELRNRLGILIGHFLKWEFQSELRSKSWKATIREQRKQVQLNLKDNPSLKSYLEEAIGEAYELALALVVRETPLDYKDLPSECPYAIAQILDPQFPEGSDR
ncbi:DUF29 domain-containing protein [Tumidithrix elongata RA019]|uniref:DUF29 domain-containing protein n=1 Tax=Tumidithrix elongata BACA0141 TaxID=2716417 RepID=A0AAW9Q5Z6_9CYAN|nr:DUF29 domain-containing protein [Tumidithrix elongata RA019]